MTLRLAVLALAAGAAGCGPAFSFHPSNLPANFNFAAAEDLIFGSGGCGPRAELDTDSGTVRCFQAGGGLFDPPFQTSVTNSVVQSDTTPLMVFAGRNITIHPGTEVQIRGDRPAVILAVGNFTVAGIISAQDPIYKGVGQGGGFSSPTGSTPAKGLGPGGGYAVTGAGAGGGSYCGRGGPGGTDTGTATAGAAGGDPYGTPELMPLRGGSSGGKQGSPLAGAGGGAVHLVASGQLEITVDGVINMGGMGGAWFGNGGGSGGAVLLEGDTVIVTGTIAANGGGGGGGASAGGQSGDNATGGGAAATGGAGGSGGSAGGNGSVGASIDGMAALGSSGQPGGGGGGAGRIRINTASGSATLTGLLSPVPSTACVTQGTVAPAR